jgi:WD40 repeat protein/energy-coupling factor transporter ATP-binding protein EcfA2
MDNQNKEDQPNVQADNNSIAVGGISIGGDISGNITIGHTGYTVEQVSVLLTQITSTFQPKPFDGRCPYKGLEVFEEDDADLFFGRKRLVEDLVSRVKETRTVFITGPSGSGKSSLVRAGLLHALKQGAIKNLHSERWLYETMKPGREPIKELALAFPAWKSPDLANYFRGRASEINILNECAESVLTGRKDQRFLLFIDQFEEVFTQIGNEEERVAMINMLAHAGTIENGRVIILFAMRSDFLSNCATYPALNEMLSQQFKQIGAMQPEELVSAIALPARHVGLPIEDELIARIINDMKGEPGALPLMQFALKDLFDSQQEKGGIIALTLEDYLRHGGIHKSLERHADRSFATLSENEQELARSIFSGLIEIGRGTQDTRRTALFGELVPANAKATEVESVVQRLADARLIITDERAGKDTVTISHEKLIDAWPWLKKLVNENRDVIALQNEIASNAKEWEEHKRDRSYLYTGARLANAREQFEAENLVLSGISHEFVMAGQAQQRRSQMARIIGFTIPVGLVVLAIIVFFYISSANSAYLAKQSEDFAETQKAAASTSDAIAVIAQANAEEAERQAEKAKKQAQIALARELAAKAQSIAAMENRSESIVVLLAMQSLKIFPTSEAVQVLLNSHMSRYPMVGMSHAGTVTAVAFSPDGEYVVSGSADGTARVWKTITYAGEEEVAHLTHNGGVSSVAFSPDGQYVVSASGTTAYIWKALSGEEVARMAHDGSVGSVAFSLDGKYVVSGSNDGTARVWDAFTGQEIARMTHDGSVGSVAFSPDSQYVVSGDYDGSARVWEAATGNEIARMTYDRGVLSVAFSPDGEYVVSGSYDGARVWEAETGNEIARMTYDRGVLSVAFSPDGKYVVSVSEHTALLWEAETGKEISRMTHEGFVTSVAFSPDGKYVVSGSRDNDDSSGWDYTARVWEAATGLEVARVAHEKAVVSVIFSPDGKFVVSAGCDEVEFGDCTKGIARLWIWQPDDLIAEVCAYSYWFDMGNLTRAQWKQYIGDTLPYQAVCPNRPIEPEPTPTP